jgi:hypothetical protein
MPIWKTSFHPPTRRLVSRLRSGNERKSVVRQRKPRKYGRVPLRHDGEPKTVVQQKICESTAATTATIVRGS